jgi:hypothetical protein
MAGVAFAAFSSTACTATVTVSCSGGLDPCGSDCVDTQNDPYNCGGCGLECNGGADECIGGVCATIACVDDNNPCSTDGDCCSEFCASDGNCGCMPSGTGDCNLDSDCCNGSCDFSSGICN